MNFWKLWNCRHARNSKAMITNERPTEAPAETYTKVDHDQPLDNDKGDLEEGDEETSPAFERTGNQLSVSRSGRHKQRLRRRSTIFENPTLGRSTGSKSPQQAAEDAGDLENGEPGEPEEEEEENDHVYWILNQRNQNRQEPFHSDTLWVTQV